MNYKKDLKKFLAKDASQAFFIIVIILVIMKLSGGITEESFVKLFTVNMAGFFGEKLTNFRGLK